MGTKDLPPQPSACIDEDRRGGPAHTVGPHGHWDRVALSIGRVHPNREMHPVFMEESAQGFDRHGFVMFEDGVQTNDHHWCPSKELGDTLRLGNAARDATRAKHLECVEHHDRTTQPVQCERLGRVQPLCRGPGWSKG